MFEVFMVLYLLVALSLIGLILIQHGKGADMGAAFGAGASSTVFGSAGQGNFLTKTTTVLAVVFFVLSIVLGRYTAGQSSQVDSWQDLSVPMSESVPAQPEENEIPFGN
ncbi:MAG: preprotein translocase subunit SecG [Alkalimonas sp.]|uniref:Protein-export membrane protein SecG n=1 Tax=Alkalimonas delamerensis TaxID=265981 RepID=A0ABT9GS58_9GAMM|nr:preprotein translocase subunit SecG [Alkalimonas delamerensis]MCC5851654.1 preprotein translocase subunit SecG [Alkalimonas sp.]MDP4529820.1 preprotein translocase subunit SecG [Alkalimonas delamerensis]